MVITSRIIELETELGRLGCQKLYDKDKDPVLADLEDKLSRLQQAYQETNLGFKIALEHNAISNPPKSSSYSKVWIEDGIPTLSCSSDTASDSSSSYAHSSTLYLLMEYCSSTLKNELENPEGFEKSKIWPFFRGIVEGLVHVHGQDIILRDISRDNIFIDGSGVPKLGDFGLAINNGDVAAGYKVDIYSLGLILVELLYPMGTGMERGTVLNNIKNGILPIDWGYDDDVTRFVLRLLKTNPSQRPSASQILTTVADW
ncbi:hypothetical protein ACH5RR_009448 [Cinchona calisaya]|uniref:Protein kinase domain-containing protein n=1 Tax=Cinchona calisaya TaxID=153742 RepID=A0ABD3AGN2_9GENT